MFSVPKIPKKILIIEDDDLYRESLSELLEILGYRVLSLPDGLGFLPSLDAFHPDLILLDLHLPNSDGFTLIQTCKNSIHQDLPILILSASQVPSDRDKAIALGARHFLPKSITVRELNQVISQELNC